MKRFLDLFYTLWFKGILLVVMVSLSWAAGVKMLDLAHLYVDDKTAFQNVILQWDSFDYDNSKHLENEIKTTVDNILAYSLKFKKEELTTQEFYTLEEEELILAIIGIAKNAVNNKTVNLSLIKNGYVDLYETEDPSTGVEIDGKYYIQRVNEENIKQDYENHKEDFLDHYRRIVDENYEKTADYLDSLKGVKYAVVNHKTDTIVSNIEDIDGKASGYPIRSCFGSNDETLLIVRNAKNPYFEAGTMSEYVEYVNECAMSYSDDFDLYISFGDSFVFRHEISYYEDLHNEMQDKISLKITDTVSHIIATALVMLILLLLAGKSEKGGKIVPAALDKLPNDLHLLLYLIIYMSVSALYENTIYMLLKSQFVDEDYWLGFSPGFYGARANLCVVFMGCAILGAACSVKRQYKLGTLFTNTYIYRFIKGHMPTGEK